MSKRHPYARKKNHEKERSGASRTTINELTFAESGKNEESVGLVLFPTNPSDVLLLV